MAGGHILSKASRLDNYISRYEGVPFHLGFNDCFLLCVRWADLLRGENVRSRYEYNSKASALKIINEAGFSVASDFFNVHYKKTNNPEIGDIVKFKTPHALGGCGIYTGNGLSYTILIGGGVGLVDRWSDAWVL